MEKEQPGAVESSEPPEKEKAVPTKPQAPTTCSTPSEKEFGGRGGLEPTRYGDWEVKGLASDF